MDTAHHLKIELENTHPAISRELLVPSDLRLDRLHEVIQIVMGWEDCHLHEFGNGLDGPRALRFGLPEQGFDDDPAMRDERKATLAALAPVEGGTFVYWYDFGDDWFHRISVRAISPIEPGVKPLVCLKATGACPPEDCGGPWGYAHLLEVLADPTHEEHAEIVEWFGDDWDPQRCDMEAINTVLARLFTSWTRKPRKQKRS